MAEASAIVARMSFGRLELQGLLIARLFPDGGTVLGPRICNEDALIILWDLAFSIGPFH